MILKHKFRQLGHDGTTMVEVMVAFVVLVLIMGIFSQALSLAGVMMGRANNLMTNNHQVAGDYYLDSGSGAMSESQCDFKFTDANGNGGSFTVKANLRTFMDNSATGKGTIYDVEPTTAAETTPAGS